MSAIRHEDRLDRIDLAEVVPLVARFFHFSGRHGFAVSARHHIALLQNPTAVGKSNRIRASVRGGGEKQAVAVCAVADALVE